MDKQCLLIILLVVVTLITLIIFKVLIFGNVSKLSEPIIDNNNGVPKYKIDLSFSYTNPSDQNPFGTIQYKDGTTTRANWNGIMIYLEQVIDPTKRNDQYILNTQPTRDQIIKLTVPPTFDSNGVLTNGPTFDSDGNCLYSIYYNQIHTTKPPDYQNYYYIINNAQRRQVLIDNMKTLVEYYSSNKTELQFVNFLRTFMSYYKPYNSSTKTGLFKEYTNDTYSTPVSVSTISKPGERTYLQINRETHPLAIPAGTYKFGVAIINDAPTLKNESDRNIFPFSMSDFALAKFVIDPLTRPTVEGFQSVLSLEVTQYD